MDRPLRIVMLAVLAVGLLVGVSSASANHVHCGEVITQDTTLDSDLVDCPGDGVVIGADGVSFDLGGHTIDGIGAGAGFSGVNDAAGYDDLTVRRGAVRDFTRAVGVTDSTGGRITRLSIGSGSALEFRRSDEFLIDRNETVDTILLFEDVDRNAIVRNRVTGSGTAILVVGFGPSDSEDNVISSNRLVGNQFGIFNVATTRTVIAHNRLIDNSEEGIHSSGFAHSARIERNTVSGGGTGIRLANVNGADVLDNRVMDNATDGILVTGTATRAVLLARNLASHNGDDGIDTDAPRVTITSNTANHNGDLGIEAVAGVTDGGGNKAHANGNPVQCLNVSCN
jgi:parallel beta-helix repeat protein